MFPDETDRLLRPRRVIDEFERGSMDVERLQSALDACAAALDNSTRDVLDELRAVEADLETILFTMPPDRQREAAHDRLRRLKRVLDEAERRG